MGCRAAILAPIYSGRDNTITLVLLGDEVVLADLSGITRVVLDLDGAQVVDTDTAPGAIWWTDQEVYRGAAVDVLRLQLGGQGLAAGSYESPSLVVYDGNHPNGLRLETPLALTVIA